MYYVYLLKDKRSKIYVGYSSNLRKRISQHLMKKVTATRNMLHPVLVYFEAYLDEKSARTREKNLKKYGSSYQGLKKRLNL